MNWYHYLILLAAVSLIVTAFAIWKAPEYPVEKLDEEREFNEPDKSPDDELP